MFGLFDSFKKSKEKVELDYLVTQLPQTFKDWLKSINLGNHEYHRRMFNKHITPDEVYEQYREDVNRLSQPIYHEHMMTFDEKLQYFDGLHEKLYQSYRDQMSDENSIVREMAKSRDRSLDLTNIIEHNAELLGLHDDVPIGDIEKYFRNNKNEEVQESLAMIKYCLHHINHFVYPLDEFIREKLFMTTIIREWEYLVRTKKGKERLRNELSLLDNRFVVLEDIELSVNHTAGKGDFVVVSPYGVLVLTMKNFDEQMSETYTLLKNGRWSTDREIPTDLRLDWLDDDLQESNHPQVIMQNVLNSEIQKDESFKSLGYINVSQTVVQVNDRVGVQNDSDYNIQYLNNVLHHVQSGSAYLSEMQVNDIVNILQKKNQFEDKYRVRDYGAEMNQHLKLLDGVRERYAILEKHLNLK